MNESIFNIWNFHPLKTAKITSFFASFSKYRGQKSRKKFWKNFPTRAHRIKFTKKFSEVISWFLTIFSTYEFFTLWKLPKLHLFSPQFPNIEAKNREKNSEKKFSARPHRVKFTKNFSGVNSSYLTRYANFHDLFLLPIDIYC